MANLERKSEHVVAKGGLPPIRYDNAKPRIPADPVLTTLGAEALDDYNGWAMLQYYMRTPWTRHGTLRAYVVPKAHEVAGRILELPAHDNQCVHKGDVLLVIDPTNYA